MAKEFDIEKFLEENYYDLKKIATMITGDTQIAEEVLHNTAVTLLRRRDLLRDVNEPTAYIAVCLRRATINYLRDGANFRKVILLDSTEHLADSKSSKPYCYAEWIIFLDRALEAYPDADREAFRRHYLEDIPIEDIAPGLGLSPNALSKRFAKMRRSIAAKNPSLLQQIEVLVLL